jgi:hypothetical protein
MTPGRPAGATTQSAAMVLSSNQDSSSGKLLLEMALQAQDMIALGQHPRVDRTVRTVAGGASFTHCFVLENERSPLRDVAFATSFLLGRKGGAAANNSRSFVGIVTIGATDSAALRKGTRMRTIEDRVRVGKTKLRALIQMTLKADLRRFSGIDDRVVRSA